MYNSLLYVYYFSTSNKSAAKQKGTVRGVTGMHTEIVVSCFKIQNDSDLNSTVEAKGIVHISHTGPGAHQGHLEGIYEQTMPLQALDLFPMVTAFKK